MDGEIATLDELREAIAAPDYQEHAEKVAGHVYGRLSSGNGRSRVAKWLRKKSIGVCEDSLGEAVQAACEFYLENPEGRAQKSLRTLVLRIAPDATEIGIADDEFANRAAYQLSRQIQDPTDSGRFIKCVSRVLKTAAESDADGLSCHKVGVRIYYGMDQWQRPPREILCDHAPWGEDAALEDRIKRMQFYERREETERKGPFRDEDILTASVQLLEICVRYLPTKVIAEGLRVQAMPGQDSGLSSYEEVGDDTVSIQNFGEPEYPDSEFEKKIAVLWSQWMQQMEALERDLLQRRILPKAVSEPDTEETLHVLGHRHGVSHGTIANREKKALRCLEDFLRKNVPDPDSNLALWKAALKKLLEILENPQQRLLTEVGTLEQEPLK